MRTLNAECPNDDGLNLSRSCNLVLFALEHYSDVAAEFDSVEYFALMGRMVPHLRTSLIEDVDRAGSAPAAAVAGGAAAAAGGAPPLP